MADLEHLWQALQNLDDKYPGIEITMTDSSPSDRLIKISASTRVLFEKCCKPSATFETLRQFEPLRQELDGQR